MLRAGSDATESVARFQFLEVELNFPPHAVDVISIFRGKELRWDIRHVEVVLGFVGVVKLWHAATGAELLTLQGSTRAVRNVDWSIDGRQLGAICEPEGLCIWDASAGHALEAER